LLVNPSHQSGYGQVLVKVWPVESAASCPDPILSPLFRRSSVECRGPDEGNTDDPSVKWTCIMSSVNSTDFASADFGTYALRCCRSSLAEIVIPRLDELFAASAIIQNGCKT
jgi:hypothetical protein